MEGLSGGEELFGGEGLFGGEELFGGGGLFGGEELFLGLRGMEFSRFFDCLGSVSSPVP